MPATLKFVLLGLLVAGLEEFITQGVLKNSYGGWIIPTLIAFLPFLLIMVVVAWWLNRRLREWVAALIYYLVAGGIGLALEWFVIGLAPWRDPHILQVPFQLGMFSFWATVAFAPRLLLDRRDALSRIRRAYQIALIFLTAAVYACTLSAPREHRFPAGIASVLIAFLLLNVFHFLYLRALARRPAR
jgi:hypothetical protein